MSQKNRMDWISPDLPFWGGPSERASHSEHQAALEATLFHASCDSDELVFELDAGELRIRQPVEP